MRSHRHARIEIDDVLVEQPDAARGHRMADALRLVGAVQAEIGVAAVAVEICLPIGGQRGVSDKERLCQPHPSQEAEGPRYARGDPASQ